MEGKKGSAFKKLYLLHFDGVLLFLCKKKSNKSIITLKKLSIIAVDALLGNISAGKKLK